MINELNFNLKVIDYFERCGCFSHLLNLSQDEVNDLYAHGTFLFKKKNFTASRNVFFLLNWLEHHNFEYTLMLGLNEYHLDKINDALMCFLRCATILMRDPRSSYYAGLCYIKLNKRNLSIKALNTCIYLSNRKQDQIFRISAEKLLKQLTKYK